MFCDLIAQIGFSYWESMFVILIMSLYLMHIFKQNYGVCILCKTSQTDCLSFPWITNTNKHDSLHVFLSREFKLENFGQHLEISLSTKGKKIVTRVHQDVVDKSKLFLLQVT